MVLGGDGYLGWPTSMHLAARGDEVLAIDNYLRRRIVAETGSAPLFETPLLPERAGILKAVSGRDVTVRIGDLTDYAFLVEQVRDWQPDAIIHFAEQPSAPYSMRDYASARLTLDNNLGTTHNVLWAIKEHAPHCHLIKLGTMGEYGTPNIDIEEGWLEVSHKGRSERFLFPRQAGSLYHTSKVLDTDLIWFYVRTHGLRVTDLMQGPVYGIASGHCDADERLVSNFHYDDIFGTVLNRFAVQAVSGVPLTVYGGGGQKRGYLSLIDSLACIELALRHPAGAGELRIFNQFTEVFSVNELAQRVKQAGDALGLGVRIQSIENPRKELEAHYYNPVFTRLLELGLKPNLLSDEVLTGILERIIRNVRRIDVNQIMPRVRWKQPDRG
jgi:UDP-sulfoquinovose synthase